MKNFLESLMAFMILFWSCVFILIIVLGPFLIMGWVIIKSVSLIVS